MATVIYWFRRDLRLDDQPGLAAALGTGAAVVPCFALDPAANPGGDDIPATRVALWRGLRGLDDALREHGSRLICRRGDAAAVIPALAREVGATAVYATRQQGAFFGERDARARAALTAQGTRFVVTTDDALVPADALRTGAGTPYAVFTPFARAWLEWLRRDEPGQVELDPGGLRLPEGLRDVAGEPADLFADDAALAGRLAPFALTAAAAHARLAEFTGTAPGGDPAAADIARYHQRRDLPGEDGTSRLSHHLAWGTLTPRAAYLAALQAGRKLRGEAREGCRVWVNELAWRDFYHHLLIHAPHAEHSAYQRVYADLPWEGDELDFDAWSAGRTGFPIVDAAMRQLNQTGWMHNRTRMIVASFLVKDLLLDWRRGEAYFARRLIDHDLASNNGGWQWSASTGTDAQPYFRVFNPTAQSMRYDPAGVYIQRWVPELARVPVAARHAPFAALTQAERRALCPEYPPPMVDHAARRQRALDLFARARAASPPPGSATP